jgi:hypothetical protein
MSTMAEIIFTHQPTYEVPGVGCTCDGLIPDHSTVEDYAEHVAAELAKAGYGKLEDLTPVGFLDSIRADAWDEGAQFSMCYGPAYSNDNPYRGAGHE